MHRYIIYNLFSVKMIIIKKINYWFVCVRENLMREVLNRPLGSAWSEEENPGGVFRIAGC